MIGLILFTVIVTVVELLPVIFEAVIVYVFVAEVAVGVPEIIPVDVSNDNPAGKAVFIDQLVGVPPVFVGVSDVIVAPTE